MSNEREDNRSLNPAYRFLPRCLFVTLSQHSLMDDNEVSSAELVEVDSALEVCAPVVSEPTTDGELSGLVCTSGLFEVLMTRPVVVGSKMRDWSVPLLLGEGRVMSAVA